MDGTEFCDLPGGMRLAYKVSGDGQAPLVLLHGYTFSLELWDKVADDNPDCIVYRYDLRGFGHSSHGGDYDYGSYVEDLRLFLDEVRIERPVIVGHSLGGSIAQLFAIRYPSRLSGLVLSNVRPLNVSLPDPIAGHIAERKVAYATRIGTERVIRERMPLYFAKGNILPADLEPFIERALAADPEALKALLDTMYLTGQVSDAVLATAEMPVLAIYGDRDINTPAALAENYRRAWRDIEIAVIADCGHNPMWERPGEWRRLVTDFLKRKIS